MPELSILTVNAGSSSSKLRLLGPDDRILTGGELPAREGTADRMALPELVRVMGSPDAIGHRFVHGGTGIPRSAR